MFSVNGSTNPGQLYGNYVANSNTVVRPVISLKSCVEFEGNGLSNDPYTVKELTDEDTCATSEN